MPTEITRANADDADIADYPDHAVYSDNAVYPDNADDSLHRRQVTSRKPIGHEPSLSTMGETPS